MDRLLSPQEIESAIISVGEDSFYKPSAWLSLTEAQDAKTAPIVRKEVNEEWVVAIENQRDNICCVGQETTLCHLADPCCSFMRESCNWWQARKKEVGL